MKEVLVHEDRNHWMLMQRSDVLAKIGKWQSQDHPLDLEFQAKTFSLSVSTSNFGCGGFYGTSDWDGCPRRKFKGTHLKAE
eukprot:3761063-Ditylum_brightwellii.AAC.1